MLTRSALLLVAAIVCFVVLFLIAIDALAGSNTAAWLAAGLAFFAASFLP